MLSASHSIKISRRCLETTLMLLATMIVCLVYLLVRNYGLYVSVPDEWEYSESARLLPLEAVGFPSYLYFLIYRVTSFCGAGFIECVRLINCVFFVGAIPFMYRVARLVSTRLIALLIVLVAVFGPINTYTAYFMPESLYFLSFWILAWCALCGTSARPAIYGACLGIIIGLMALVKVHAVFLVPVIAAFLVLRTAINSGINSRSIRIAAISLVAFLSVAALVRFGLGYIFAGRAGLSLLGAFYNSVSPSVVDADRYTHLIMLALVSLEGHVMGLASLFALPLASLFYFHTKNVAIVGATNGPSDIRLFTFLALACLLMVTVAFTANISSTSAFETIARLHMRYYSFTFPLLLMVAAELMAKTSTHSTRYRALVPAVIFGGLAILAAMKLLHFYTPGFVDGAEIRGLTTNHSIFMGAVVAGVLTLAAWVWDIRVGVKLFLFVVAPSIAICSGYYVNVELRQRMVPDSYAEAGIFAKQYIGRNSERTIVVGADHSSLYRTLFYLDSANATSLVVPADGQIANASIPADAKWLLVVGDEKLPKEARNEIGFGGFVLARVGSEETQTIDFTLGSWPGLVASAQGLSNPEPWGTWSDGNRVVLEFSKPLPKEFTLVLKGHTIGDTNQPSTMVVGEERREIRLPSPGELALLFRTDGNVRSISIEIPWARSMREIGVSQDPRRLGIGFVSIQIIAKVPAETP